MRAGLPAGGWQTTVFPAQETYEDISRCDP
jgi:hypothetical protein